MIKRWATFDFGIDFGANFKSNRIIANWSRRREGKEIHVKRVPLYTLYDWGKVIRWKDTDGWVAGWEHQMKTSLYTQRCSYLPMWCRLCAARVYGGGWWEGVELQFAARRIASSDRILSSLYSLAEGNERTTWVGGRERENWIVPERPTWMPHYPVSAIVHSRCSHPPHSSAAPSPPP